MPDQKTNITYKELRETPEPEMIKTIDYHLGGIDLTQKSDIVARIFHDELVRRSQDKFNQVMLNYTQEVHRFTKQMRNMTIIILFATIVTTALGIYQIFCK
jgi:hypothetical protein